MNKQTYFCFMKILTWRKQHNEPVISHDSTSISTEHDRFLFLSKFPKTADEL
jgi:hypothetical protein